MAPHVCDDDAQPMSLSPQQLMSQATRVLLQFHDPESSSRLDSLDLTPDQYGHSWFSTLYASCFKNVFTLLALWRECLSRHASETMVFFVAAAWLTMHRQLLRSEGSEGSGQVYSFLFGVFDDDCSPSTEGAADGRERPSFPLPKLMSEALELRVATPSSFLALLAAVSGRRWMVWSRAASTHRETSAAAMPSPHKWRAMTIAAYILYLFGI
ncbi:unnamed protein product [Vitrella brassicaformis CCMP3155]|uniref:Rab-GAP TBC domain-containing protein n=1 Tax=Vitrella brassicaformis (strain CCMP3155) TaxID=1169540 RepID=A0A0G4FK37_VITBC|nr:unnamed protein product [Vitrella brassicaformis CCMP3155]|eukprot:CEM14074.1 unnamed protein product [Vitrella brassicaformis CCMP3155]